MRQSSPVMFHIICKVLVLIFLVRQNISLQRCVSAGVHGVVAVHV